MLNLFHNGIDFDFKNNENFLSIRCYSRAVLFLELLFLHLGSCVGIRQLFIGFYIHFCDMLSSHDIMGYVL